jgi:Neuraminidase (sialidase)
MISLCYYSDDNGYAWYPSEKPADLGTTTDEPSIVELKDGRLLMIFRTERGYLGQAYSSDGGQTWTEGQLTDLPSPCAPECLKRIPSTGDLLVIWCHNPEAPALFQQGADQPKVPIGQIPDVALGHVRAPLSSAISRDDGQTWEHIRNIEDNPPGGYGDFGYPGCTFIQEGGQEVAVLNYNALDGIRVTRIGVDWFYGQ